MPTLCDYTGVPFLPGLPGLSLKATVNGRDAKDPRKYIVVSNHMVQGAPIDGVTPTPAGRMVRSRRYKYCVYSLGERRESLVDMEKDPGEMVNLALSRQHREVLAQHRQYLAEWCRQTSDSFAVPEKAQDDD
jgi:choline-sulfatase/glucosamine-6-phosphate deaminase